MRRKFKKVQKKPIYKANHRINAPSLRVIGPEGKQLGILSRDEALKKAFESNLDLVEIAPRANPPVAKIINLKKFLYLEEKKRKQAKKQAKSGETKEVWLTLFIAEGDLKSRIEKGRDLLKEAGKLKIVVKFKGRQITKKQLSFELINKYINSLGSVKLEREPHFEGRRLIALVSKK